MKPNYLLQISKPILIFFLLCMVIFTTGCAHQTKTIKSSTYYFTLQTKEIKTKISELENALKSEDDSLSRPTTLFYLALLYSHSKNPEPDYKHALKNLEEYISLDPETEQKSSVPYLMSLLKKLVKNENLCNELKTHITTLKQENKTLNELKTHITTLKQENKTLTEFKTVITTLKQENKTLTEKYEKLRIENQNTKEIIEKLKQLDIQLEKKRGEAEMKTSFSLDELIDIEELQSINGWANRRGKQRGQRLHVLVYGLSE